ncbi:type II secretion system protein [Vibrio rotiferianus]|uniref:type II secretion system protein n=1 Tax=Vibrio rotiferianus TaxID=190895 RepID=UPI003980619C
MKRQGGFTLIELVVVIVILGILAVTAAPRFLNLQQDARASALAGLSGAITGAAGIVYGKSAIEGEERINKSETPAAEGVATHFGYPTTAALPNAVTGLNEDWETMTGVTVTNAGGATQTYGFVGTATTGWAFDADNADAATGCYVIYVEAADADTPAYSRAVTTDC